MALHDRSIDRRASVDIMLRDRPIVACSKDPSTVLLYRSITQIHRKRVTPIPWFCANRPILLQLANIANVYFIPFCRYSYGVTIILTRPNRESNRFIATRRTPQTQEAVYTRSLQTICPPINSRRKNRPLPQDDS